MQVVLEYGFKSISFRKVGMRTYECPECGSVKLSKEWAYCSNPCEDVAMVEVMAFGKSYMTQKLEATLIKLQNEPLKSGV